MDDPVSSEDDQLDELNTAARLPENGPLPTEEPAPPKEQRPNEQRIGPGLRESVAWTFGLLAVQVVVTVMAMGGMRIVGFIFESSGIDLQRGEFADWLKPFTEPSETLWLLLIAQASTVLYAAFAIRVRNGSAGFRALGWKLPSVAEVFATLLLSLPMFLVGGSLVGIITRISPDLDWGLEHLQEQIAPGPIWITVLSLAVFPAVGEELFSRGLIGHGLTNRYPTWLGVILTSLLFGAMHLNPAQSLAVIPIAIVLHCLYLTSRSIWLPIFLHFANNFVSILFVISRQSVVLPEWIRDQSGVAPVELLVVSAGLVMTALLWLRELRLVQVNAPANLQALHSGDDDKTIGDRIAVDVDQVRRQRLVALLALALLIHVAGFLLLLLQA